MFFNRISLNQEFEWQHNQYRIYRLPSDTEVNIENLQTGAISLVSRTELLRAYAEQELVFKGKSWLLPDDVSKSRSLSVDDYPEHLVKEAKRRYSIIQPLVFQERTENEIKQRMSQIKEIAPSDSLSVATMYRWIKRYEDSEGSLLSLVPGFAKRGPKGHQRLSPEVVSILASTIDEMVYVRELVTARSVWLEVHRRVDEVNRHRTESAPIVAPSYKTVVRRINALDTKERVERTKGKREARKLIRQYSKTGPLETPLERVEIDHTVADVNVVDDRGLKLGRPTLTLCIDVATRYPLGCFLSFEPPSLYAVMECLYHAILPKNVTFDFQTENEWLAHGIPGTLVTDRGKEFMALDDACASLGINLDHAAPRAPEMKAFVERMFRTLNSTLFHTLPGTTFSNIQKRGDYDSDGMAIVTLAELREILTVILVDHYAQSPHQGLGTTPAKAWQAAIDNGFAPRLPDRASSLHVILGCTEKRTIQSDGIHIHNLVYDTPGLGLLRVKLEDQARLQGKTKSLTVKVKYHPGNISRIWILDPFTMEYLEVPCENQEYTHNLSIWQHRKITEQRNLEMNDADWAGLGRTLKRVRDIVQPSGKAAKMSGRKRNARWNSTKEMDPISNESVPTHEYDELPEEISSFIEASSNKIWGIEYNALPQSRNRNST